MGFHARLDTAWATSATMLCVGLDPEPNGLPTGLAAGTDGVAEFCMAIVDATADLVCAYKPQFAHFAAVGAEQALERVCRHIRDRAPHAVTILDAKRGDVASTARHYATEAFDRYGVDAVTVNPYLGTDAAEPFLARGGVIALCRTSNQGGRDVQDLVVDGRPLYHHVARMVADEWSRIGECALVVGAPFPAEVADVRAVVGTMPILLPGIGVQGGDLAGSVAAGRTANGFGLIASASRSIIQASTGADFAEAARASAVVMRDALAAAAVAG